MASRKFLSGTLKNKYGSLLLRHDSLHIICFSGAKKFLAVFSPALAFSLVLSLVLRQEKERFAHLISHPVFKELKLWRDCSFSFVRPKENEPKEKGAGENGPDNCHYRDRHVPEEEGDFNMRRYIYDSRDSRNRLFADLERFCGMGT